MGIVLRACLRTGYKLIRKRAVRLAVVNLARHTVLISEWCPQQGQRGLSHPRAPLDFSHMDILLQFGIQTGVCLFIFIFF